MQSGASVCAFCPLGRAAGGSLIYLVLAIAVVLVWAASGPLFGWSDTWQLVINTGTTIVTFLMVFVIQNTPEPRHAGDAAET
jgi:low affinity Fe/Cu permease